MTGRWYGWGDRYDAIGAVAGAVPVVVIGLLTHAWLPALAMGFAAMNVTSLLLRRITGAEPKRRRDRTAARPGERTTSRTSRPRRGE